MTDSAKEPSKGAWTPGPWEARPVYWANHPNDPADKPTSIYCYSIYGPAGSHLYIEKVNTKEDAMLISKSPQMADLLSRLMKANAAHYLAPELVVISAEAERLLTDLEVKP